jgi:hypothetical protein
MKDTDKLDKLVFPERYLEGGEEEEGEEEEEEGGGGEEGGRRAGKVPLLPAGLALLPPEEGEEEEEEGREGGREVGSVNTALSRERQQRQMRMRRGGVDVEAAVMVLKGAGYLEHALEIARKYRCVFILFMSLLIYLFVCFFFVSFMYLFVLLINLFIHLFICLFIFCFFYVFICFIN